VLHGDCVFDSQLGVTILSGDTIVRGLAEALQPGYCVFLADVAGLYNKPPEQPGAVLMPAVEVAANGSWSVPAAGAGGGVRQEGTAGSSAGGVAVELTAAAHDTTGGIAAKVAEAAAVVLAGCPVVIAQAGTAAGAAAVMHGPAAFLGHSDSSSGGQQLQGTVVRLAGDAAAGDVSS
jgi:isopentenyl phosphate kinase